MTRRERHKQDKQSRVYSAAWELFSRQGFEATTVRQIADAADVSVGTVMLYGGHSGDKGGLLRALFRRSIAQALVTSRPPKPGESLSDTLYGMFVPFWEFYRQQPQLARVFVRQVLYEQSADEGRADAEQMTAFMAALSGELSARQQRGELRPDADPALMAQTLFALHQATLQGWLSGMMTLEEAQSHLRRAVAQQVTLMHPPSHLQ